MRALRNVVVVGSMISAALVLADGVEASPPEIARPAVAQIVDHVEAPIRGRATSGVPGASLNSARKTSNGISYHGGPVMTSGVKVYVIWYGNWTGDSATTILPTLVGGLGASPYYAINTTYYDGAGSPVPAKVTLSGAITDNYSQGATNLSDAQINAVVASAISSGRLPLDATGLYFVLTSTDVTKSGFLTSYCGWHAHSAMGGVDVKYSFVGDPGTNAACAAQTSVSPNGNVGADAMASVMAHELEETATDPALNAWYDIRGYENADKCAWTFGTTYTTTNGAKANMNVGGLHFLIQRNWVNASGGYCSLK